MAPELPCDLENGFERLARILTRARHAQSPLRPEDASALVRECVEIASLEFLHDPRRTLAKFTCGVLKCYLTLELDAAHAAVAILKAAPSLSVDHAPSQLMTWAMEGMALVAFIAGPQQQSQMHAAIDAGLAGAGPVFQQVCAGLA